MVQYYKKIFIFARNLLENAMKKLKTIISAVVFLAAATTDAQKNQEIVLWPNGAPTSNGVDTDTAKVYVSLPDAKRATGRCIVICPGGGYSHLAMNHEGHDWAPFFNNMGIATVVLKYRMPHGVCQVPLEDAEEAMRLVRRNAKQWNINPDQVGIMGSSAGGHLASTLATRSKGDAAANFQILFYPVITMDPSFTHLGSHDNLLGKDAKKKLEREYSNDLQVTRVTPRAFIVLSDNDHAVLPVNGVNYYFECYRHDVPASLHVYPTGGHGWGIRTSFAFHVEMMQELRTWLNSF